MIKLYEILVPVTKTAWFGTPSKLVKYFGKNIHNDPTGWDEFVSKIAGGLTIVKKTTGVWAPPATQEQIKEEMVIVRIAATHDQMIKIMDFTKEYYKQEQVIAWVVSEEVLIK